MKKTISVVLTIMMCLAICQNMALAGTLNGTEYINEEYGYKIIFPESWNGYISVKEYEGMAGVGICFDGKSNTSKENPYKEEPLFSILSQTTMEDERDTLDSIQKAGEANGVNYYRATGTGIPGCFYYLHEKVYSNGIEANDVKLAKADLEMQQKIMSESDLVKVQEIKKTAVSESPVEKTTFQAPVNINPMGNFYLTTEFDDYTYIVNHSGELSRYNKILETNEGKIASDVASFITDNKTVYYTSWEKQGIYKIDIASGVETQVFSGKADSLDGCWNNKYLYYYEYEGGYPDCNTWVLDLETGETWILLGESGIGSLYGCGTNIYFTIYGGDRNSGDLYVAEPDGSNRKVLISNIIDFAIFDNKIYYAVCDFDYGYQTDFHMVRCNLDGSNQIVISNNIKNESICRINKTGVEVYREIYTEEIPYTIQEGSDVSQKIINIEVEEFWVRCEEFGCECQQYSILKAYSDNVCIWEYKTEVTTATELELVSDVVIDNDTAYIVIHTDLYAFDLYSGQIKWTSSIGGAGNCIEIGPYNTICVSAYYRPNVVIVSKDGRELYRDESNDYAWVYDLECVGERLKIYYDFEQPGIKYLDMSQFKESATDTEITVTIDGKKVEFDQPPIIVDDRTLVPVRAIFEALGATVDWEGTTQTVTSTKGTTTISMTIGKTQMYKNGTLITLDVPPQLVSDRTLVPVRAVAESFDCKVDWDGDNQTVIITTTN